jgi:hypothetical protein
MRPATGDDYFIDTCSALSTGLPLALIDLQAAPMQAFDDTGSTYLNAFETLAFDGLAEAGRDILNLWQFRQRKTPLNQGRRETKV